MTIQNRRYQEDIIREVEKFFAGGHGRVLIQCPTGSGKTIIATQLANRAALRRVLYVVPGEEIFKQTSAKLDALGIRHIHLTAGKKPSMAGERVLLAMSQTLANRRAGTMFVDWEPDLLILDEVHRRYDENSRVMTKWAVPAIGMTATPARLDGKRLSDQFPALVLGPEIGDLQQQGYLVPATTYIGAVPDLRGLRRRKHDFDDVEAQQRYLDSGVLSMIPPTWAKLAKGKRTITFAPGVDASRALVQEYAKVGARFVHLDGNTPQKEREGALAALRSHRIDGISNVGLFIEGLDVVEVECVTSVRPTLSLVYHVQSIGRGLRPSPKSGKRTLVVLDHSGNSQRHGLIGAPRDWSKPLTRRHHPIRACRRCAVALPLAEATCPYCGFAEKARRASAAAVELAERRRSLRTPVRDCPRWAAGFSESWFKFEQRRARNGLPLPSEATGEPGYTESMVRREHGG